MQTARALLSALSFTTPLTVLSLSCKGPTDTEPPIAAIALDRVSDTIGQDSRTTFHATVTDSAGVPVDAASLTWSSSDTSVAVVSGGVVTGLEPGRATIRAEAQNVAATASLLVVLQFQNVSAGTSYTCGVSLDGTGYCWGTNDYGQLGNGSTASASVPSVVKTNDKFVSIAAGRYSTCGISRGGTTLCWGLGEGGQLGNGGTQGDSEPTVVVGTHSFRLVTAGRSNLQHNCALDAGGKAWCWGWDNGAFGAGAAEVQYSTLPALAGSDSTFTVLSAGFQSGCGLTGDGTAYCWGDNTHGRAGNGEVGVSYGYPTVVLGGLSFVSIKAGVNHTCGITLTKEAYCWGWNRAGQLGNGLQSDSEVEAAPVHAASPLTFEAIDLGADFTCGITTDRRLFCWGVGYGPTPVELSVPTAKQIDLGYSHGCMVGDDDFAYCWSFGDMNPFLVGS